MATVRFSSEDEFLDELRRSDGLVDGRVLRVTNRWRRGNPTILQTVTTVTVVASFVAAGHVVVLDRFVAEFTPESPGAEAAARRAGEVRAAIEKAAGELALEVRAGVFE